MQRAPAAAADLMDRCAPRRGTIPRDLFARAASRCDTGSWGASEERVITRQEQSGFRLCAILARRQGFVRWARCATLLRLDGPESNGHLGGETARTPGLFFAADRPSQSERSA